MAILRIYYNRYTAKTLLSERVKIAQHFSNRYRRNIDFVVLLTLTLFDYHCFILHLPYSYIMHDLTLLFTFPCFTLTTQTPYSCFTLYQPSFPFHLSLPCHTYYSSPDLTLRSSSLYLNSHSFNTGFYPNLTFNMRTSSH